MTQKERQDGLMFGVFVVLLASTAALLWTFHRATLAVSTLETLLWAVLGLACWYVEIGAAHTLCLLATTRKNQKRKHDER